MSARWTPTIGDPSALGWITVIAYFAAAIMCALAARRAGGVPKARRLWVCLAVLMLLLGVNKQLDLQTLLTELGRDVARRHGWYEQRRTLQAAFIFAVMAVGGTVLMTLWHGGAMVRRNIDGAVTGMVIVFTYVIIRASSFHHVDIFINRRVFGVKWNWIFELGGIGIILIAAGREWRDLFQDAPDPR